MTSFTCHANDLRNALAFARQATERRNTIPILGMIRIDVTDAGATLTGTGLNVECARTAEVIATTGAPFSLVMVPHNLSDVLRWATGEVTVTLQDDLLTITADEVEFTTRNLWPAADWPALLGPVTEPITMGEDALHRAIVAVIDCVSTEETRYYLNGVYIHPTETGLRTVATDGHRLAVYDTASAWPFDPVIVPRKTVAILSRALRSGGNRAVSICASKDPANAPEATLAPKPPGFRIRVAGDGWSITGKTIDGKYPDYTRVIGDRSDNITATLSDAGLRRFPPSRGGTRSITIDPKAGRMSMASPFGDSLSMPVQATGESAIGFSIDYLRAFARRSGTIRIETKNAGSPAHILTEDPALLQVLMPMRM
jgi:DNA polymerase III subunit beta